MKKKLKLDMTLRILIAVLILFTLSNIGITYFVRNQMQQDADTKANNEIDKLVLYTNQQLATAESAAANMNSQLERDDLSSASTVYAELERFLDVNPQLVGAVVALDPSKVTPQTDDPQWMEKGCCLMVARTDTGYMKMPLQSMMDYQHADWYKTAMASDSSRWIAPMRGMGKEVFAPYVTKIKNARGETLGILRTAISLDSISHRLDKAKPYENSTVLLVDAGRRFLTHPNPKMVLNMSIDSLLAMSQIDVNESIFYNISHAQRGENNISDADGDKMVLYYAPIEKTGWTVILKSAESDIYAGTNRMKLAMLISMLFNLCFFGAICWRIIKMTENLEAEAKKESRIESELNTASRIQMSMVPKLFPPYPERDDVDIFAAIAPAKAVGGDLYDFFIKDDNLYFCIGDVSGKGVPASLFMAITRTLFRVVSSQTDNPAEILEQMNDNISANNEENMFVTMQIARLNLKTGDLYYSNAGHNAPVVLKKSVATADGLTQAGFRKINAGLPLGCMVGFKYTLEQAKLDPSDAIFVYTDGITEAENLTHELFGDERLTATLGSQKREADVAEVVEGVIGSVRQHAGEANQSDDITALCMQWFGPQGGAKNPSRKNNNETKI